MAEGRKTMHRAKHRRACALALSCAVMLMACGHRARLDDRYARATRRRRSTEDESQAVRGGRLVFGLTAESSGWSPVADQWALDGHFVASTIYDPLMAVAPNRQIVPELAEVVEHNDDFTDLDVAPAPGCAVPRRLAVRCCGGEGEPRRVAARIGAVTLTPIESVDAVDPATVVVTMRNTVVGVPVDARGPAGLHGGARDAGRRFGRTRPIGTGPFVLRAMGSRSPARD